MNYRNRVFWICLFGAFIFLSGCNITLQIKDGQTAYDLKKYVLATELLTEEFEKAKDKTEKHRIATMIAKSYLAYSNTNKAEFWYKKAMDLDVDGEDMLAYALVLKQNEKYEEALETLKLYYAYDRSARLIVEGHTAAIEELLDARENETYTTLKNLTAINTEHSEYGPMRYRDQFWYASTTPKAETVDDAWTGEGYADLVQLTIVDHDEFHTAELWSDRWNSKWHEALPAMHPDGDEMYFTRCGMDDDNTDVCKIYRSYKDFDLWSDPEQVFFFDDSVNVGHPSISSDGKQLFFSSDMEDGYGGKDLYVANRIGEEWDVPINLGPRVNTPGDELFPHLNEDGKLFFASDGHYGYGGLDLFMAEKRGRIFTSVESLPYPVNTGGDDFSIYLLESEEDSVELTGYFASNRQGGMGADDIYYFEKRLAPAIKLPPPLFLLELVVVEDVFENPENPNSPITGERGLAGVSVDVKDISDSDRPYLVNTIETDEDGKTMTVLDEDFDYSIDFRKRSYFSKQELVSTRNMNAEPGDTIVIAREVKLERIFKEIEFTINNIYYDLDSANIRPDAALVLDSLAGILVQNPGLRVELGSHTDARGSDEYNLNLSQRRANSAVQYLINNGIQEGRLTARGYGETRLVNECTNGVSCPEEKHQENRRTTFKILGVDYVPVE